MPEEQQLEHHVAELRWRLKHSFIVLVVLTAVAFYFSPQMLTWLQHDLTMELNALVAYEVLYTRLMMSVLAGVLMSLPVLMYHGIKFAQPGLKPEEYRVLRNYLPMSVILFVAGAVFAYQVIVKSSLDFFQSVTTGSGVEAVWGLQNTLGFALKLSAFTGIMFQLPIAALVLAKAGLIDRESMIQYRSYFMVAVLLLAAVATPPDIVTQVMLTVPVMGLYQLSIFLVDRTEKNSL
ncbi:MAG: twin-arginine translocase subunit TatC [Candidatus Nanohalobium sp.]